MGAMASQITSLTIVYSSVYSGADQRKHQSTASLAFLRGIHRWPMNSPHKGQVTRKMFPFDHVIMKPPLGQIMAWRRTHRQTRRKNSLSIEHKRTNFREIYVTRQQFSVAKRIWISQNGNWRWLSTSIVCYHLCIDRSHLQYRISISWIKLHYGYIFESIILLFLTIGEADKEEVARQWSHDDGNTKSELYENTKRWLRHDMDTLPTLLALCEENVPLSRERVSSAETVTPSSCTCTALHSLGFSIAFIEITIPCIDFHLSDENSSIEFFNMMPKTVTIRREENCKWALSMTLNILA